MRLSVVIPAHNEQENIADVIKAIEDSIDIPFELVLVNDHSIDNTAEIVRGLCKNYNNIRMVENKRDLGFANALKTGFSYVKTDLVIPVMGDLCDDLSTIKKMVAKIDEGYDIVCGSRYIKEGNRTGGSMIKGVLSSSAGWTINRLLGIPTHDIANAFKMYRKIVLESIEVKSVGFEISMEIPLKAYFKGFRITEVPTAWRERTKGKSSFRIVRLLPNYLKLYFWAVFKKIF